MYITGFKQVRRLVYITSGTARRSRRCGEKRCMIIARPIASQTGF